MNHTGEGCLAAALPRLSPVLLLMAALTAGPAVAQTHPAAQPLPYFQDWGTDSFSVMPPGTAAWNGMNGNDTNTQSAAEGSIPGGDARVTPVTDNQYVAGSYGLGYLFNAPGRDRMAHGGRYFVQTGSHPIEGANQLAIAIDTRGRRRIQVSYVVETITAQTRVTGVVMQYRTSSDEGWRSCYGFGNPIAYQPATTNVRNPAFVVLPADADDRPFVELRWALWRASAPFDPSAGLAIDDIRVDGDPIVWNITATAGPGGRVDPAGVIPVPDGGSQSFSFLPDPCHAIADVRVDGSSVGAPASYTFSDVHADHTLEVSFAREPDAAPVVHVPRLRKRVVFVGAVETIAWTASDDRGVTGVRIDLSRDDGATFEEVAAGLPASGSYAWTVSGPPTNPRGRPAFAAFLRVEALDACGNVGEGRSRSFAIAARGGGAPPSRALECEVEGPIPAVASLEAMALVPRLSMAPNPSAGPTRFEFVVAGGAPVRLGVVDLQGREVARVVDGRLPPGLHHASWDGTTARGPAPPGLYFVCYRTAEASLIRRLILTR